MKTNSYSHLPTSWETVLDIRTSLNQFITGHRLCHTLSVEKEAVDIAKLLFPAFGIDEGYLADVSCAALLHDITKHFSLDEHIEICKKYGIDLSDKAVMSPALLHSKTGAYIAREKFGINDVVFNAVFNHTSGCEEMDIISKIIFIADYIEPTRSHDSCKQVRKMFYDGISQGVSPIQMLDKCIVKSIDLTIDYLLKQNSLIHIQTVLTRNCILAESALRQSVEGI